MTSKLILITDNHPLASKIAQTEYDIIEVDPVALYELSPNDFEDRELIIDLTIMDTDSKLELLNSVNNFCDTTIVSDTTINWGEYLVENVGSLHGAMALAFYSPKKATEVFAKNDKVFKQISSFLTEIGFEAIRVKSPGICFNYPRIASMIINEAYFAIEENLASAKDIDTAMKYGVNYPLGPVEWAKKISPFILINVLIELFRVTEDVRYRVSSRLKLKY